ncbi:MAG: nucleotide exchange factor GrpE [Alphaproteobacteria bacterium]|nr:nucleotide exchange factor GrpE [Alphaproteobacteria bacterium]
MKKHKNNANFHKTVNIDEEKQENPDIEIENEKLIQDEAEDNAKDEKIARLEKDIMSLRDEYLRACAELENTKRRCAQELEKNSKYAVSSFAKELLGVADNLHRALEAAASDNIEQMEQFKKGVELTEQELMKVLNKFGITKIDSMGKIFDPAVHQVVQKVEDATKEKGTIIAELQTGYMINGRLLREAMVVVAG